MPTEELIIQTVSKFLVAPSDNPNEWVDIFLQNLGPTGNIYVGSAADPSQMTTPALKVLVNGHYTNDHRGDPVWVIADAINTAIRVHYVKFIDSTRKRV